MAAILFSRLYSATVTNSITYHDHQTVDSWYTDSTNVLYVPQFNPDIGVPIKAQVYLKLNITNIFAFENLDRRSYSDIDFVGNIGVTNSIQASFFGVQVLNLFATNIFSGTGYDGVTDFGGTSGVKITNIVQKTVTFTVAPADVSGYSVWESVSRSSARSSATMYTGSLQYIVYTTAGADIWVVYTYLNQYNCPDCDKDCDKDKDSDKKDSDKDKSYSNKEQKKKK